MPRESIRGCLLDRAIEHATPGLKGGDNDAGSSHSSEGMATLLRVLVASGDAIETARTLGVGRNESAWPDRRRRAVPDPRLDLLRVGRARGLSAGRLPVPTEASLDASSREHCGLVAQNGSTGLAEPRKL